MGLIEATLEGAKLRLRPIVMTSLAFGFGVLPLAFASGAGAGAQKAIGTGVLGGVVTATFLVTLFAPLFYVLIEKLFGKHRKGEAAKKTDIHPSGEHDMKRNLFFLLGVIVVILSGCTLAPKYTQPEAPIPGPGRPVRPTKKAKPRPGPRSPRS